MGSSGDEGLGPVIRGVVAFFDESKGFGSIKRAGDGATIWLSRNALKKHSNGSRVVVQGGDHVAFRVKPQRPDQRYPTAVDVCLASSIQEEAGPWGKEKEKGKGKGKGAWEVQADERGRGAENERVEPSPMQEAFESPALRAGDVGITGVAENGFGSKSPFGLDDERHVPEAAVGFSDMSLGHAHHPGMLGHGQLYQGHGHDNYESHRPTQMGLSEGSPSLAGSHSPRLPVDTVWNVPLPRTTVLTNTIINAVREMEEAYREREAELEAREKHLVTREKKLREKTLKVERKLKEGEIRVTRQVQKQLEQAKAECERMRTEARDVVEQAMESSRRGVVKELAEAKHEVEQWEREKQLIRQAHKFESEKVKLDVGGKRFSTTRAVLTGPTAQGTLLADMFSGKHKLRREKDGTVLLDRDNRAFRYVLNFLRSPQEFQAPVDETEYRQLLADAEFYRMPHQLFERIIFLDAAQCSPSYHVADDLSVASNDDVAYHVQEHCMLTAMELAGCPVPMLNVNTHLTVTPNEAASFRFDFGAVSRVTLESLRFRFYFRGFYETSVPPESWNIRLQGKKAGGSEWVVLMDDCISIKNHPTALGSLFASGVVVTAPIISDEQIFLDEVVLEVENEEESGTLSVYGVEFFGSYQLLREVYLVRSRWAAGKDHQREDAVW